MAVFWPLSSVWLIILKSWNKSNLCDRSFSALSINLICFPKELFYMFFYMFISLSFFVFPIQHVFHAYPVISLGENVSEFFNLLSLFSKVMIYNGWYWRQALHNVNLSQQIRTIGWEGLNTWDQEANHFYLDLFENARGLEKVQHIIWLASIWWKENLI